jgi:hypothetical protein
MANSQALKVPRQCPFVLLVEIRLRDGKALGSEKGKGLGSGFVIRREEKRREEKTREEERREGQRREEKRREAKGRGEERRGEKRREEKRREEKRREEKRREEKRREKRLIMMMEKSVEWKAGETEVL